PPVYINTRDVAALLRCAQSTVLKYVSEGKLPRPAKIGRLTRWRCDMLLAFLEARWGVATQTGTHQTHGSRSEQILVPRPRKPKVEQTPYVHPVRARGKDYYYYDPRRGTDGASGARHLPGCPQDLEFWREYRRLHGDEELRGPPQTMGTLIDAYVESPEFG